MTILIEGMIVLKNSGVINSRVVRLLLNNSIYVVHVEGFPIHPTASYGEAIVYEGTNLDHANNAYNAYLK